MYVIHYLQVVGSLSDGIGKVHLDAKHNTKREQIRSTSHDSGGQFVSGMKGLGHGMLGGFKSVLKPFEGARKGGAEVCRSNYCKLRKICEGFIFAKLCFLTLFPEIKFSGKFLSLQNRAADF